MNQEFQMIAKTFKGLEQVLADELLKLGANNIEILRRAVTFTGDKRLLYKSNLWLRTASRVLVPITEFKANDADEVYENVKQIPWEDYLSSDNSFCIDATVYSETFRHSQYVVYRTKDAIVDRFQEVEGRRPSVKVTDADLYINVHIAENKVMVSLDSSGESLHRRGWRESQTVAPLNEALAAGMILLSGWQGQTDFYDPMCGSGTLLIEAAMIAKNIPPGLYRQHFAFERWRDFDKDLFEDLYNDDSEEKEFEHHIYGSDSGFYAIQVAEKNVKKSGLKKYISLHQRQIQSMPQVVEPSMVIINPPYGERIKKGENVEGLYKEIGTVLKHQFAGSTAWIISSNEDALKQIGLRHSQKLHLMNGELDCLYMQYELFKGERKEYKKQIATENGKNTNRKVQLSSPRRENSKISSPKPQRKPSAAVQKRRNKRG